MKKNTYIYIIALFLIPSLWIGCSEWLEVESKDFFEKPADEYYAALREYKKTDHQITFGWFGNWSGEGTSLVNSLAGIPDSVDLVSIWGN